MRQRKNLIKSLSILLLGLGLGSCYTEINEEPNNNEANQISIKAHINELESHSTRVKNNLFEIDDEIGFFLIDSQNKIHLKNIPFKYSKGNIFESKEEVFYPSDKSESTAYAYYPYNSNEQDKPLKIGFSICKDQSSIKSLNESDFLIATKHEVRSSKKALELKFNHQLAKLKVSLRISSDYDINDLMHISPNISLINFPTQAYYSFTENTISDFDDNQNIIPLTKWSINKDKLIGCEAIVIPSLTYEKQKVQIEAEGIVYECDLPSNFNIKSNTVNELILLFTPSKGIEINQVISDIGDWDDGIELEVVPRPLDDAISIKSLDFTNSNILNLINSDGIIRAKLALELLKNEELENQAIIIYPYNNNNINYKDGIILDIAMDGSIKDEYILANITWIGDDFKITPNDLPSPRYIFVDKNGDIKFNEPEKSEVITIKEDYIIDKRNDELIEYPIVKLANVIWMRSNLNSKYFRNGDKLAFGDNKEVISPGYSIYDPNPTEKIYNQAAAISDKGLCPDGWSLPTEHTYNKMLEYIDNKFHFVYNKEYSNEPKANLSCLNFKITGAFGKTGYNTDVSAYWAYDNALYFCTSRPDKLFVPKKVDTTDPEQRKTCSIRCVKQ